MDWDLLRYFSFFIATKALSSIFFKKPQISQIKKKFEWLCVNLLATNSRIILN